MHPTITKVNGAHAGPPEQQIKQSHADSAGNGSRLFAKQDCENKQWDISKMNQSAPAVQTADEC